MSKNYDQRCYDLAVAFLEDVSTELIEPERAASSLAEVIQNAVEEWIDFDSHRFRKTMVANDL